ncbi:SubName: Full=Uncharacterized protein {ECO:0000313/EMBL:CCA73815.1} [Serendipita indica DSM 11827]|nr:SubName: Full=Uncharacterized protein {ECO:0000313/EMBL:CCA73815.1} [Serendipita indica DSM 11827]
MHHPVVPTPKVVNIFEDGKPIDIATPFDLARIQAQYIPLFQGKQFTSKVLPGVNQICYVITGEGSLTKDNKSAPLRVDDCFSFAAAKDVERTYTVDAKESDMGLLVISDTPHVMPVVLTKEPPAFPKIINAPSVSVWRGTAIDTTKSAKLTKETDIADLPSIPWHLNIERIPSRHPVIQRTCPFCRRRGATPEKILKSGDVVGWKAGTGIAHTLLNDAQNEQGDGEDLVFLCWGEDRPDEDKVFYAAASPSWWKPEVRWMERPVHGQGHAPPFPVFPRPDGKPFPEEPKAGAQGSW